MKTIRSIIAAALLTLMAVTASAADAAAFYSSLLQRGVSSTLRGSYARAVTELRVAAFGSIDDLVAYQTAQVYIAYSQHKLGKKEEARVAATKAVQAERISPTFSRLTLDPAVRSEFEKLVPQLVAPELIASLAAFEPRPTKPATTTNLGAVTGTVAQPKAKGTQAPVIPPVQTTTTKPAAPAPAVATQKPAPAIANTRPAAPATRPANPSVAPITTAPTAPITTASVAPITATPLAPTSAQPVSPIVAASRRAPSASARLGDARFAEAERLLMEGKILAARQAYLKLAALPQAGRPDLLRIARGLNQTSAWKESSQVYARVGTFERGEEIDMFYEAVNRYEAGELDAARDMLRRALPSLPQTREVQMYRPKIEGTR